MKTSMRSLLLALTLVLGSSAAYGQSEPLNIFGYFQTTYSSSDVDLTVPAIGLKLDRKSNSFSVQQANIFLQKGISQELSAFVNVEFTNSFSSARKWGSISLEEAWAQYRFSNALQVQAGMLIPAFNNLNEIKNRTPLLPYIQRPLIYETFNTEFADMADYVPERAFVQVRGELALGMARAEYAVHVGNSETSFLATAQGSGQDTTRYKAVGGRVGLRYRSAKIGVSATRDRENLSMSPVPPLQAMGAVPRTRIGGDLSFSLGGLSFEGEFIKILHSVDAPALDIDKLFYYGTLQYDFASRFFAYVSYDYQEGDGPMPTTSTVEAYMVGAGYRPLFNLVLKTQYQRLNLKSDIASDGIVDVIGAAVSVLF